MRLIDADALDDLICQLNEEGHEITRNEYKMIDNILFEFPTICDIDAIRREIEDLYIITNPASDPYDGGYYTALIDVKRIIDKYTKGE